MLRTALLISCCFLFVSSLKAQTEKQILSEIEIKEKLAAKYLEEGSTLDGIKITREIISLVETLDDVEKKIKVYLIFAELNTKVADYELSEYYLQKVESLIELGEFGHYLFEVSFLRTEISLQQSNFNEASLLARQNYSKLLKTSQVDYLIKVLAQLGTSNLSNNNYDSSLVYWNRLITLSENMEPSQSLAEALQYKAFVLIKLNKMDSVLLILNTSITYAKQLNNLELEVEGYISLGYYYLEEGNLDAAQKYLDLANQLSLGKGLIHSDQSMASIYHKLYVQKEDFKQALFWYKRNEILLDSLSNIGYSLKYQKEKSKQLLKQKETELILETSSNSKNRLLIIALSLGILLFILIYIQQRRLLKIRRITSLSLQEKSTLIVDQNRELELQKNNLVETNNLIKNRNSRLQFFLSKLEELTNSYIVNSGEKQNALREICLLAEECLKVSRVSIWKYDDEKESIEKEILVHHGKFDSTETVLHQKDYPKYFEALKQKLVINASDAINDSATKEFAVGYLDVLDIKSMLDVPYLLNGHFAGVICCEHQHEVKFWESEDIIFLKSLSDFISITLLSEQSLSHNKELKIINESLEDTVSKRTSELEEQNNQLREYAFINSHLLRAPLARVLGLAFLLSKEATSIKDKEIISNLLSSTEELDQIVKNISDILFDGNNLTREDILAMIGKKLDTTNNS